MLHANNCFIVLLDFDNFINSLFCNYFNYFDLVMRASSLLAFRCYFEVPSINKDFTSLHNEPNLILSKFARPLYCFFFSSAFWHFIQEYIFLDENCQ